MPNEHENDPKSTAKDEAITKRVQELRCELEQLGRFGVVSWTDDDLIEALENAGAAPTLQNVATLREHVQDIADAMTATGWTVIEDAIGDLGLATRSDSGEETGGAKNAGLK